MATYRNTESFAVHRLPVRQAEAYALSPDDWCKLIERRPLRVFATRAEAERYKDAMQARDSERVCWSITWRRHDAQGAVVDLFQYVYAG